MSPRRTSWPKLCVRPPGPFGASGVGSALTIGALGSSFCPENTQIEFALSGAGIG